MRPSFGMLKQFCMTHMQTDSYPLFKAYTLCHLSNIVVSTTATLGANSVISIHVENKSSEPQAATL